MASLRPLRKTIAAGSETSTALPAGLARALTWLRANLNESVHLDQLAQIADVHPRTLERHFRRFLDTTPHGWVRRVRLVRARQELINGDRETSITGVALDSGFSQLGRFAAQYREHFGESHYSFDHKGVHFVALDNVSRGRPEVGPDQLAWLKADVARFPNTAPIVVFTHRPLFDLKPEWEWFTADGDDVMKVLAPYENVTVLYGHIHRHHLQQNGRVKHYAARSLIFAFNDPATNVDKKPLPFNKDDPFKQLGIRQVTANGTGDKAALDVNDIVLTKAEFSGLSGMQQMIKHNTSIGGGSSNDAD